MGLKTIEKTIAVCDTCGNEIPDNDEDMEYKNKKWFCNKKCMNKWQGGNPIY